MDDVVLLAAILSSVKSSVQGRRPITSTTLPTASVPFLRTTSRSVSKWFEVEHAVKLKVKIWWLSWKSFSIVWHGNGGKVTLILLIVSQFKDVDQETDKPHFIKNAITALPTNFVQVALVNSNNFCAQRKAEIPRQSATRSKWRHEGYKQSTTRSLKRILCWSYSGISFIQYINQQNSHGKIKQNTTCT
jgi:hypothetical protein